MSRTRLLTAAVALFLVTGAVFLVTNPLGDIGSLRTHGPPAPPETVPVLVAAVDVFCSRQFCATQLGDRV